MVMMRSEPVSGGPLATPPAVQWSAVLRDVPVPERCRLDFYSVGNGNPPIGVALYDLLGTPPIEVLEWYRRVLPSLGWRREVTAEGERWLARDGWLAMRLATGRGGALRLRLARASDGAALWPERALTVDTPLPQSVERRRFDRADLLPEEYRYRGPLAEAQRAFLATLADAGYRSIGSQQLGDARVVSLQGGSRSVTMAIRAMEGGTEVALGRTRCRLADDDPSGQPVAAAVYLAGVPAPPAAHLEAYDRDPYPLEQWRSPCQDLDLLADWFDDRLQASGWQRRLTDSTGEENRGPAVVQNDYWAAELGQVLHVALVPAGGGQVLIQLQSEASQLRSEVGSSLRFADVPLPGDAEALSYRSHTADGWQHREVYAVPSLTNRWRVQWLGNALRQAGWRFAGPPGGTSGSGEVYAASGEEVLVQYHMPAAGQLTLSRRRICTTDSPLPPLPGSVPARHLLEMAVYPRASYAGFAEGVERYSVTCVDLGVVADWYRRTMEQGHWRLAAVEGTDDPDRRRLLFVRPSELSLLPVQRTGWAEVELVRTWPYQYELALRRDPGGILPLPPDT